MSIPAKRKPGPRPFLVDPKRVIFQLNSADVDYLDQNAGPRDRSDIIREAVAEWISRHKARTIVAGMRP